MGHGPILIKDVQGTEKAVELVSEIATATHEQAEGIAQVKALMADLEGFVGGRDLTDDVTLIVVKVL